MEIRTASNRVAVWNGTVHYAEAGRPACGSATRTGADWLRPTLATVTCSKCIARFGEDEPGHTDEPVINESIVRRAEERAKRQAERRTN